MKINVNKERVIGQRSLMLYGQFLEHFHRQTYGGIYDPGNALSDEAGLRLDVIDAMKKIKVPIIRWPGGCFVSSYHWKDGVGEKRVPSFDKAWRVEDPNTFGTDEFIDFCRKVGCEPYICTNAGTGTAEEMSDWVEYCNLENEGQYAKWRIANGHREPHNVKYWSIGNENYGWWEIGAKNEKEWSELVLESAKMIKHVSPETELSAAALTDLHWNMAILEKASDFLDWISVHEYWDEINNDNNYANYEQIMAYTDHIGHSIDEVRGLLTAMKLDKKIKIAFDEWNLFGWYHPGVHVIHQAKTKEEYLYPRDENDDNTKYSMSEAIFSACFLNELNRNCDIVGMANYSPIVNTRGCIFTYKDGIVLRPTYHVYDLFVNYMGDMVLDGWSLDIPKLKATAKDGTNHEVDGIDFLCTGWSDKPGYAVSAVNKFSDQDQLITLPEVDASEVIQYTICGDCVDAYNDVNHTGVKIEEKFKGSYEKGMQISLPAHSINVIQMK